MVQTFSVNNITVSAPVVEYVLETSCPPLAADSGLKTACLENPDTLQPSSTYQVLKWNGYTYWALSYIDNRVSFAIIAYDAAGKPVQMWAKPGARYLVRIEVDTVGKTVTFVGQSNANIVMPWDELWVAPAPSNVPVVEYVPLTNCPPAPAGVGCRPLGGATSYESSPPAPVLQWGGYTYWAYSYTDNRYSFAIAVYDAAGNLVHIWEKEGSRYLERIEVDLVGKQVIFVGQSSTTVTMTWDELLSFSSNGGTIPAVAVPAPAPVPLEPAIECIPLDQPGVTTPTIEYVPLISLPQAPSGLWFCPLGGATTYESSPPAPVLKWNGYTYYAFSYTDNRYSLAIVVYDASGNIVYQWEKAGARYLYRIEIDIVNKLVIFFGQSDTTVVMTWDELCSIQPVSEPLFGQFQVPLTSFPGIDFTNNFGAALSFTFSPSGNWKPATWADCTAAGWKNFAYQFTMLFPDYTSFALLALNKQAGFVKEVTSEITITLQPGETLNFFMNDISQYYDDNTGSIVVAWSAK